MKPTNVQSLPGPAGERALMARIRAGEPPAYRELYQAQAPRLLRVLLHVLRRDRALAEEVLQLTFVAAFKALGEGQAVEALGPWLTRIAVRLAFNAARGERRREAHLAAQPEPPPAQPRPDDRDAAAQVLRLIEQLDEPKRTTMLLCAEGYTPAEIAEVLGEPRGTVLARVWRTRAQLAEQAVALGLIEERPAAQEGDR